MGVRRDHHGFEAQAPELILARLVAVCWQAGRRLHECALDDAPAAAVRRCAIELSVLTEACGASPLASLEASASRAAPGRACDVVGAYRAALRAPLPRAVQSVLHDHLARLERALAGAPSHLLARVPAARPSTRSLAA